MVKNEFQNQQSSMILTFLKTHKNLLNCSKLAVLLTPSVLMSVLNKKADLNVSSPPVSLKNSNREKVNMVMCSLV